MRKEGLLQSESLESLLLNAHLVEDLSVDLAPAAAGLWRILTVIAARVTGLDNQALLPQEWFAQRDSILDQGAFDPSAVSSYFDQHAERFDLFDPQWPWLQDSRLADQCARATGLNTVVFGRPAGNNQAWMSHHRDADPVPIDAGEAALQLIAQLYYGAPGRCTARTVDGRSEANAKSAPLRGLVSYHPVGPNVFESLLVSIPFLEKDPTSDGEDYAWWELPRLPDPMAPPQPTRGVGGVLAGRFCHALLLVASPDREQAVDGYRTWAFRHPVPAVEDPFLIYQTSKAGQRYARFANADRALWRDLDGLLLDDAGIEHSHRPKVFAHAMQLDDPEVLEQLRVRAFGFDQDRAQTSDRQWYTATTPPVLRRLADPETAAALSRARIAAEMIARRMDRAVRTAWIAINDPGNGGPDSLPADSRKAGPVRRESDIDPGPWVATAAARYWPTAEREFWRQIRDNDFDHPLRRFRTLGLQAFDETTDGAGHRPRTRRAIERARTLLFETPEKK